MTQYEAFVARLSNGNKQLMAQRLHDNPALSDLFHATVGLSGESGEVLDQVKKAVYYGLPLNTQNLLEEMGDVLHYLTAAAVSQGYTLQDLQQANTEKLNKRFPEGVFSAEKAIQRLDKATQS